MVWSHQGPVPACGWTRRNRAAQPDAAVRLAAVRRRSRRPRLLLVAAAALLSTGCAAAQDAGTTHFRYERTIETPVSGAACAVLDAAVMTHAAGTLADLRLFPAKASAPGAGEATVSATQLPFFLTVSGTEGRDSDPAAVQNLRTDGTGIGFDLLMPARAYTDVVLLIDSGDFAAVAHVYSDDESPAARRDLGEFALFDFSARGLPRSTTLHLQESTRGRVHVLLMPLPGTPPLTPGMLHGAVVPPSRSAQTLYTTAASTTEVRQQGTDTVARIALPARLPVERLRIVLARGDASVFSREVTVSSRPDNDPGDLGETLSGHIGQLHLRRGDVLLSAEQLTMPATLGANLQGAASVRVAILNGAAPPLPVREVALEMRQRQICFNVPPGIRAVRLFYGDAAQEPARAEAAPADAMLQPARTVVLGPERLNPRFVPRQDDRSLRRRHPRLLYLGLILLICGTGVLALRSSRLRV